MGMINKALLAALVIILFMLAGCAGNLPQAQVPADQAEPGQQQNVGNSALPAADTMNITVYHATSDAMQVTPEVHVVAKNDHPAKTAMEMLLAGTSKPGSVSVIPEGTKLRRVSIKDHIAYVDFNDKIIKNNRGGSASEILLVASIVNTLTEMKDIEKVQILVEGKKVETLAGHLDVSEPLSRSEQIIKKQL